MLVTVGHAHTCAVGLEAKVQCWGQNEQGQCDVDGPVAAMKVGSMGAGLVNTCAVGGQGELACWGQDANGDENGVQRPQRLQETRYFVQTSAGLGHTCSIVDRKHVDTGAGGLSHFEPSTDSEVLCWGQNGQGQAAVPPRVREGDVWFVASGLDFSCCVLAEKWHDQVECWGSDAHRQLQVPPHLSRHVVRLPETWWHRSSQLYQLATGVWHSCALRQGRQDVVCWGLSEGGEAGLERGWNEGVMAVAAGAAATCVVDRTENVRCWGSNHEGVCDPPFLLA